MLHGFLNTRPDIEPVDRALDLMAEVVAERPSRCRHDAEPAAAGLQPRPEHRRVDGAYYLVTSTFEYLPGLPVYRSTDLVDVEHDRQRRHPAEQVELEEVPTRAASGRPPSGTATASSTSSSR